MNKRLLILLLLMVLIPGLILSWFGYRFLAQEESIQEVRLNKLVLEQLRNIDQEIQRYMINHQQELGLILSRMDGLNDWRTVQQQYPVVRQAFIIDSAGEKVYPNSEQEITNNERAFLERSQMLWQDQNLFQATSVNLNESDESSLYSRVQKQVYKPNKQGWYSWFWANGLNIIYWLQTTNGTVIGADLDTMRIKSDLIILLPETSTKNATDDLIKLIDGGGDLVYQWGNYKPDSDITPTQRLPLSAPLNGWSLEYYLADDSAAAIRQLNIVGLISLFLLLLGFIAYYLYKESRRDASIALQKVNFVNQVSHELKTPLTNIRMYAELLDDVVEDTNPNANHYLNVITTESQRLSRLISNVLSFGRSERKVLQIQTCQGSVATIIKKCIETFEPILQQKNFEIIFNEQNLPDVVFDPDALEQILNNLISNVEKYAADGNYLELQHEYSSGITSIRVIDRGPGIPSTEQKKIFDPFYRISNQLSDGIAGTGIGLNIARQLARLHGGDIKIIDSQTGNCFEVTLVTPQAE